MKNHNLLLAVTLCLFFIYSCTAPQGGAETIDMDAVRAEIQAMEDAYAVASNANDADAQVSYYADDAQSMGPEEPTLVGKEAILAKTKEDMAKDSSGNTIRFEIVDLYAAGNLAVEVGKWISTDKEGEETTGKYVSVFEKRDGKYICIRDIYNSDSDDDDDKDGDDESDDDD
jgi:ketosteroid isomerase-like protein